MYAVMEVSVVSLHGIERYEVNGFSTDVMHEQPRALMDKPSYRKPIVGPFFNGHYITINGVQHMLLDRFETVEAYNFYSK